MTKVKRFRVRDTDRTPVSGAQLDIRLPGRFCKISVCVVTCGL